MRIARGRNQWAAFAILLSVSAVLAHSYFSMVDRPNIDRRMELHDQILCGVAPSPYNYRVLVPFATEIVVGAMTRFLTRPQAFELAYAAFDFVALAVFLVALFILARQWFSPEQSLIGALFAAGTLPIALRLHYYQPWSLLEPGLFTLGLLCIYKRRYWPTALVILIATLNRETAVFIPAAFLATQFHSRSTDKPVNALLLFAAYAVLWLSVFEGLRYIQGSAQHLDTVAELWARNMRPGTLPKAGLNLSLFFGVFLIFAALGFRRAPVFLQRAALVIPFYVVAAAVFVDWVEVRVLMPLFAVVIPLGLSYLYTPCVPSSAEVSSEPDSTPSRHA